MKLTPSLKQLCNLSVSLPALLVAGNLHAGEADQLSVPPVNPYADAGVDDGRPMIRKGDQELTLSGQLDFDGLKDVDYNFRFGYGWFLADGWEFGLTGSAMDQNDSRQYSAGLFTEYNFGSQGPWVPFIGVSAEWAGLDANVRKLDVSSSGVALGGQIGIKYFIRPNIAISTALTYTWATDDIFNAVDSFEDNTSTVLIGLRIYF